MTCADGLRTSLSLLPSYFPNLEDCVVKNECVHICWLFLMTSWRRCLGQGCMTPLGAPPPNTTWLICSLYGSVLARPSTHDGNPSLMSLQHLDLHSVKNGQSSCAKLTAALTQSIYVYMHCLLRGNAIIVQQSYAEVCSLRDNTITHPHHSA